MAAMAAEPAAVDAVLPASAGSRSGKDPCSSSTLTHAFGMALRLSRLFGCVCNAVGVFFF